MAASAFSQIVRQLPGVLTRQDTAGLPEADLWERYVQQQDAAAFETLVRRHGPMVMGVCRRILRNEQDAEDAFQVTFLLLVRRAASLQSPSTLANWLYGVAYRTALEARNAAARRRAREAVVRPRTVMPESSRAELWSVLDEELARLTEKYRIAVVLCDLEGKTRQEVARQLGWAEGTVASRLTRGRSILAKRLARRGFAGALVGVALADGAASACVPGERVVATVTAACLPAAPGETAKMILSANVIALTEGVLKSMFLTKIKIVLTVCVVLGIAALSARGLISNTQATEPAGGLLAAEEPGQPKPDDLHERVLELKQQLQQMQKKIASLEQETQPKGAERKPRDTTAPTLFPHRVRFEIGNTETKEGGRIEIREVWGTRPRIEVGGMYLVRGKYVLPKGERGIIHFYETATGDWGQVGQTTLDLQTIALEKQEGEFTLVHGMVGPGYFHLYLAPPEKYSRMFANVYFGTGDNVLRDKP